MRFPTKSAVMLNAVIIAFTVVARALSGVHWLSDIVGDLLLSRGLVMAYRAIAFGCKGNATQV